jgi:outer membrane protein assembly factor BamE
MNRKTLFRILSVCLFFCLVGCSYVRPYHVPVQQGNVLETKDVQQLALGMSKNEVEDLLGTPVLRNAFADNYWTYVYTNKINGKKLEKKQLIVYFAGNKLVKVEKKNI